MNEFDLSVAVTAHDETFVSGPTMRSADAAIALAESRGISVERCIALDNARPETVAYFSQRAFDHWNRVELDQGDLGRARNELVPILKGRNVAFLDADDLFSENWLAESVRLVDSHAEAGRRVIAHPELNWFFDGARNVFRKTPERDLLFDPVNFYFNNYYDSLCLSPRSAHLEVPYVSRDIPAGLSFQDWQFSVETMAAGWEHVIALDTVIFKRKRDDSLVSESRSRRSIIRTLPSLAIDRIDHLASHSASG